MTSETQAAARGFADYWAMGPERSLEKLAKRYRQEYQAGTNPPTRSLGTLRHWNDWHAWQARVAGLIAQEREEAQAKVLQERERILGEGLAQAHRRVEQLKELAKFELDQCFTLLKQMKEDIKVEHPELDRRYRIMKPALDKTLQALAEETGGRPTHVAITRDLVTFAKDLAREQGYDEGVAIELAKDLAREHMRGL